MHWTPAELVKISGGFWAANALHAAVALDVFSPLAGHALSAEELAEHTGTSVRGCSMLATAMTALNLLAREGEAYALTPFARQYLVRDSADYMGHIIRHHHDLVAGWSHLADAVRTGLPVRVSASDTPSLEERESFLLGMVTMSTVQAVQCVPCIPLDGRTRLLDVGGGPGAYAVQFCREHPHMTATVFDLPTTQDFAEHHIAQCGMTDRISVVAGDFITDPLPRGYDVVWMSHILHGEGPEVCAALVSRAARSLVPGGLLLIQEFVVDDARTGPVFPALFGLNMLVNTIEGAVYTESELRAMLTAAGAVKVSRLPLELENGRGILAGVMPEVMPKSVDGAMTK